ncbi:4-(cytidine 5'-diphospho)-2-C-methyl-D-erythritol kinase [Parabacteroides sp. PF5-6]|uniref:4-(cytidine 5'-diphospho)-2-C-methyl-D-erythritol kinase n=1 Tax=Parabacteroides sp. PF5-6 TaxID=1742403 RepID=UPI002404B821|nr:4-(cytidine 5'-diphospho)-2-C-methyl-D-erythritol kinase [Parabacteroides sp. PF5-6]MDF9830747.1 4-diphosphocytidyl-2-C-methyl-D-erythritol kinase [Parabacteroides sp. PF5-6]
MLSFPNAKINLGLNVVSKRPDGYHDIETIFYPIPVKDALEIVFCGEKDVFHSEGIPVEAAPADNLVMRALRLLREQYEIPPLEIYLMKGIPFGAGLGGGSSDAAFMLKLVNTLCALHIPDERLEELAASIGADCPFFIRNTPVFAGGIGNIFSPVSLSLKGYHLCLVKPNIMVSTPEAYAQVTPQAPSISLKEIIRMPVSQWREWMVNDFEASVFSRYPLIGEIKDYFYQCGALYASMSGSGSSVFALFTEDPGLCLQEQFPDCFVWQGNLP